MYYRGYNVLPFIGLHAIWKKCRVCSPPFFSLFPNWVAGRDACVSVDLPICLPVCLRDRPFVYRQTSKRLPHQWTEFLLVFRFCFLCLFVLFSGTTANQFQCCDGRSGWSRPDTAVSLASYRSTGFAVSYSLLLLFFAISWRIKMNVLYSIFDTAISRRPRSPQQEGASRNLWDT